MHTESVTGATRTCNATPKCGAQKTMPVVGAPRHDRVWGKKPPGECEQSTAALRPTQLERPNRVEYDVPGDE
jgi:hypothetical protein